MDCFAEPVIGRRVAPTRWLAMTGRDSAVAIPRMLRSAPRLRRGALLI
jgi:hypothetical protein